MAAMIQCFDAAYDAIGWFGMFILGVISIACAGYVSYIIVCRAEIKREFGEDIYHFWELFIGIGDLIMRKMFL